jgi:hypothetical protein
MKKLLMASNRQYFSVARVRTAFVFLIGVALVSTFSMATAPMANAAEMTPTQMIQSQLPRGKTIANATKTEFLGAVCAAVKKFRELAPAITMAAIHAHQDWRREILRTVITCLGLEDCNLIATVVATAIQTVPDDASGLMELAIQLAPNCRDAIGQIPAGGGVGGVFTNPPDNQNPPPGTVGGGGGGGFNPEDTRLTVCDNAVNVIVLASQLAAYLTAHPGAFVGACVVTPATNQ